MPNFLPNDNPLSYLGVRPETPADTIVARRAPASTDKKPIGTIWVNKVTGIYYSLVNYVAGVPTWQVLGGASADVNTLTGDSGGAISPTAGNINILGGTGVAVSGSGSTLTINVTGSGLEYTTVTADTPMAVNQGYITNKAGTAASMTLPAVAAVGDVVSVVGRGATGWSVAQNAGQSIHMNAATTTVGVGGSLASTAQYNTVLLLCTVANTEFTVINNEGILTVT